MIEYNCFSSSIIIKAVNQTAFILALKGSPNPKTCAGKLPFTLIYCCSIRQTLRVSPSVG